MACKHRTKGLCEDCVVDRVSGLTELFCAAVREDPDAESFPEQVQATLAGAVVETLQDTDAVFETVAALLSDSLLRTAYAHHDAREFWNDRLRAMDKTIEDLAARAGRFDDEDGVTD